MLAKWADTAPLAMLDQYIPNIKRLTALGLDAGNDDRSIAATIKELDQSLPTESPMSTKSIQAITSTTCLINSSDPAENRQP